MMMQLAQMQAAFSFLGGRETMTEETAIHKLDQPNTRTSLAKKFSELGLKEGMVVVVHSSLSAFGWVCGGPVAVIQALMDVVGMDGTIVMPTQSADNSDPSDWENPPVPQEWWETIRNEMPAYDPTYTPTRGMGQIVETFRSFPHVKRSSHPMYSFAAWGKYAETILSEQPLEAGFGPQSPLGKLYHLDGYILLLGVTHDSNTSLHLAEHAISNKKKVQKGTVIMENGKRVWKTYEEIEYDSDPFEALGQAFETAHPVKKAIIGQAECRFMKQREAVDFARHWLQQKATL